MKLVSWLAGYLVIGSVIGLSAIGSGNREIAAGTDVSGVIRDVRGRPIARARVSLMRVDDAPPEKAGGTPTKTLVELDTLRTTATGAFHFPRVSNGRYQLLIARDRDWMIAEGLRLTGDPVGPFSLVLDGKTRLITLPVKRLPAA